MSAGGSVRSDMFGFAEKRQMGNGGIGVSLCTVRKCLQILALLLKTVSC